MRIMTDELTGVCPACGTRVAGGDRFCEDCGAVLHGEAAAVPDRRDLAVAGTAAVTDRGKRHAHNEDAMALRVLEDTGTAVLVVCDGVSSSQRAVEAAECAATVAADRLAAELRAGGNPDEATTTAIIAAAAAVAALGATGTGETANDLAAQQDPYGLDVTAPCCTIVTAVVTATAVTVGSIGDSRAYWLAAANARTPARCLSTDDSVAAGLMALGVDEATALTSPEAHTLTAWLGADAPAPEPHVRTLVPAGPGLVLVCSDGLWNYFPAAATLAGFALPEALPGAPRATTTPLALAHRLADLALIAGGGDNITVAVAPFPPSA